MVMNECIFLGSYAKFIGLPSIRLPAEALVRVRQVLGQSNIRSILNVGRLKVNGPATEQTVSVLLIVSPTIVDI